MQAQNEPSILHTTSVTSSLVCVCGTLPKHCGPKVPRSRVPVILRIKTECETSGMDFALIAGTQSLRSPYKALCRGLGLALSLPSVSECSRAQLGPEWRGYTSTPRCFQSCSSHPENLQSSFPTTSLKTPTSVGGKFFIFAQVAAKWHILNVYEICSAQI